MAHKNRRKRNSRVEAANVSVVEKDIKPVGKPPANSQLPLTFLGSAKNTTVSNAATSTVNLDLTSLRSGRNTFDVIRSLVKVSPDLSQAVATKISAAISDTFTAYACTLDGQIDRDATLLLHAIIARMNYMSPDYTRFNPVPSIRALSESFLMDDVRYGAMMSELVLSKSRLPLHIKHIPSSLVQWKEKGGGVIPIISLNGQTIELDYPTIIYSSAFQDGETAYSDSQIETAVQPVLFQEEFKGDLRRAVRNVILPRLKISIKTDEWRKTIPQSVQEDEEKMKTYMADTITSLETRLNTLNPEDAVVVFDILDPTYMTHGNISTDRDISVLSALLSGNVASGAKTLPAILGNSTTQGAGSSESMIFMKGVEAAQERLNTLLSRIFTLSLRLFGLDVYAKFSFDDVNLRPKVELEAFLAMKQSRVKELLSLGMETDEMACITLTGHLPPEGYKPLMGTMFIGASATPSANPYSNTSVDPANIDESTVDKAKAPDTPTGVKSK